MQYSLTSLAKQDLKQCGRIKHTSGISVFFGDGPPCTLLNVFFALPYITCLSGNQTIVQLALLGVWQWGRGLSLSEKKNKTILSTPFHNLLKGFIFSNMM